MKINQHPLLRNIFGLLLISFFPALTLGGEPKVKKQDPSIFFWYHFRTAVIQNNLPKLKELTRFPFETTDANGTITKTPRGSFANLFHPLMETPVKNKKTMREIITAKEDLTTEERAALKEGKIQIGSFRFQTIKNVCYFIGASLAPEPPAAKKTAVAVPLAAVPARVEKTIPPPPAPSPTASPDFDKSDEEPLQNLAASPPKEKSTEKTPTESLEKNVPAVTEADDSALSPVFRFYWVAFRQAALNNDVEKVKS
ncbi:MAG: hypothetical protein IPN90_12180 [Elusimicrobia bacterium]|nr:hypothetical protein [Elusimicrobiota bacterium]